jgi:hypothetical protein
VLLLVSTLSNGQELTEKSPPSDTGFVMQKSPWGAVARSAIIPGLGQFYNESYWKIPVIWGVGALFISGWVYNNNLYKDYKNLFIETGNNNYLSYRDFYRDQRDNFTIYLVLLYILNLVDAYVDAHLYDFNVEEDFITGSSRVNFRLYF